jgi:hypothetical protein
MGFSRLGWAALVEDSEVHFALLLLLVFLIPVAAYCLILAAINRRLHPVMVSGPWDAAGLLFAASGALVFVIPATMGIFYRNKLTDVPADGSSLPPFKELVAQWWLVWTLYFVALIGGAILFLWLRRGKTMIYNVGPMDLDRLLAQLLDRLGLEWNRLGNRVVVTAGREAVTLASQDAFTAETPVAEITPPRPPGEAVIDVEPFHTMCHVTLHWRQHSGLLREELEAELGRALPQLLAPDHPTAGWLMGLAAFLLAVIFMGILITVLSGYFLRH